MSRDLHRLLAPRSIAVVGGNAAAIVADKCRHIGFSGELFAVHPSRAELGGVTCARSLEELPCVPDACFLGVSPDQTIDYVTRLANMGAGGAVCYASGFAESGDDGVDRQKRLVQSAGELPLVGPNCHGYINFLDGVALWPDHFGGTRVERGPALLMQSGNIGINVTFQQRELAPAYVIAMGNNAQLQVHDYVHALLDDPRVTAIGLHLEGIEDVPRFSEAALRALAQNVPLVALKTGSSTLGAEMALSHTRSMSRPDNLVTMVFERCGVARCRTLPEFLETLKFVAVGGAIECTTTLIDEHDKASLPARIVSMSCSGGEASHLADLVNAVDSGGYSGACAVEFPVLSEQTARAVSDVLGPRVHLSNPLDYHTYAWGNLDILTRAFTALLGDSFDCALLILDYPPPDQYDVSLWQVAEEALCAASRETNTRVVVVSSLAENFPASARERLLNQNVAPMQGMMECVQAIAHARTIGLARAKMDTCSGEYNVNVHRLERRSGAYKVLDEYAAKSALKSFGLSIPGSLSVTAEELEQQVGQIEAVVGYPLVVKASGAHLTHKTELDAVRLNINSRAGLIAAGAELATISDTLLVESMVVGAIAELLIGVRAEPGFGQVLTLGSGGVLVELLNDSVEVLLPAARDEVQTALMSLNVGRLLSGYRNRPAGNVEAVLDAIEGIVRYAWHHQDRLIDIEVNPLLVLPARMASIDADSAPDSNDHDSDVPGAVVVDALINLVTNE